MTPGSHRLGRTARCRILIELTPSLARNDCPHSASDCCAGTVLTMSSLVKGTTAAPDGYLLAATNVTTSGVQTVITTQATLPDAVPTGSFALHDHLVSSSPKASITNPKAWRWQAMVINVAAGVAVTTSSLAAATQGLSYADGVSAKAQSPDSR
jgi:hypothetical protein